MLRKVISGGQTGADRAGLLVAKFYGYKTGGWMPLGFKAQDGFHPEFATELGMKEHLSLSYPPRTRKNVQTSDGTVRFATDWKSPGERLTISLILELDKPYIDFNPFNQDPKHYNSLVEWLNDYKIGVLNVAGNSERTSPGIFKATYKFLKQVFNRLKHDRDS